MPGLHVRVYRFIRTIEFIVQKKKKEKHTPSPAMIDYCLSLNITKKGADEVVNAGLTKEKNLANVRIGGHLLNEIEENLVNTNGHR